MLSDEKLREQNKFVERYICRNLGVLGKVTRGVGERDENGGWVLR